MKANSLLLLFKKYLKSFIKENNLSLHLHLLSNQVCLSIHPLILKLQQQLFYFLFFLNNF